ncbi:hypothetical protein ScPMuIL_009693 [Solemya velum]
MQKLNRTPDVNDVFQFNSSNYGYRGSIYGVPTTTSDYEAHTATSIYGTHTATNVYGAHTTTDDYSLPSTTNEYGVYAKTNAYGITNPTSDNRGVSTTDYYPQSPTSQYPQCPTSQYPQPPTSQYPRPLASNYVVGTTTKNNTLPSAISDHGVPTTIGDNGVPTTTRENRTTSSTCDYTLPPTTNDYALPSTMNKFALPFTTSDYGVTTINGGCITPTTSGSYEQKNVDTPNQSHIFNTEPCDIFGLSTSFLIGKHPSDDDQSALQNLADCCMSNSLYAEFPRFDDHNYTPTDSSFGSLTTTPVDSSSVSSSDPGNDFSSASSPQSITYSNDNTPSDETSGFSALASSPDTSASSSTSGSSQTSGTSTASDSSSTSDPTTQRASKSKSDISDGKKNTRTKYTAEQTNRLERLFQENQYPNQDSVERIATDIGVTEGRIRIWFQNKRARWRRLANSGKLHPSQPTNTTCEQLNKEQEMATTSPFTYTGVQQHFPTSSVNYQQPYQYNYNCSEPPQANSQIQQAIVNLMYSSADAAPQLPQPYHAVTSLYQQIANSPYSYTPI